MGTVWHMFNFLLFGDFHRYTALKREPNRTEASTHWQPYCSKPKIHFHYSSRYSPRTFLMGFACFLEWLYFCCAAWHEQVKRAPYSPRWQLECLAVVAIVPKHDFGRCSPVQKVLPSNIQRIFGLDHHFVTFWIAESKMFGRRIGGIKLLNTITSFPVAGTTHCRLPWTRTHAIQCWDSVRKRWTNVTTPLLCLDAHVRASDG